MAVTIVSGSGVAQYACPLVFANGLWWLFYRQSTGTYSYTTSADGTTWAGGISLGTATFYAMQATVYGTTLHLVAKGLSVAYTIFYRMGTLNSDGTITWAATWQLVYGGSSSHYPICWDIKCDSTGYPMVTIAEGESTFWHLRVDKSSTKDGTWTNVNMLNRSHTTEPKGLLCVTPAGNIYLADGLYYPSMVSFDMTITKWDGSSFVSCGYGTSGYFYLKDLECEGETIHVLYTMVDDVLYRSTLTGSTWTKAEVIDTGVTLGPTNEEALCVDGPTGGSVVWVKPDDHVYYKMDGGSIVDWQDETGDTLTVYCNMTYFYNPVTGYAGVAYVTGSALANLTLKFALLQLIVIPVTVSSSDRIGYIRHIYRRRYYQGRIKLGGYETQKNLPDSYTSVLLDKVLTDKMAKAGIPDIGKKGGGSSGWGKVTQNDNIKLPKATADEVASAIVDDLMGSY